MRAAGSCPLSGDATGALYDQPGSPPAVLPQCLRTGTEGAGRPVRQSLKTFMWTAPGREVISRVRVPNFLRPSPRTAK